MTAPRQRAAAAGLFLLLAAAAGGAGWWARSVEAALAAEHTAKAELYDMLKRRPAVDRAGAPASIPDRRDPYLSGDSETIAAAGLQRHVRGLVEAAGGEVFSSQLVVRAEPEAAERRVELQLVFEGSIETVQAALFAIETGVPFGFVDELALVPARAEAVDDPAEAGRLLRTTLTVSAFWRRPG